MESKQKTKWSSIEHRIILYSLVFFLLYAAIFSVSVFSKSTDAQSADSLFGIDFADYYTAGRMTISGDIAHVFQIETHHKNLEQLLGIEVPFTLPWRYPPVFLLMIIPFALFPFRFALVVWVMVTLALAVVAVWRMLPSRKGLVALLLGFPGVLMNLRWGQNGFLSVALLGLGVGFLESNPVLSGAMLGLLVYKPQFAFLPLIMLLITKRWKALISAASSALIVSLLSLAVFGVDHWVQFFQSLFGSSANLLEVERASIAAIQVTAYNALMLLGIHPAVSAVMQGIITVTMIFTVRWVWKHTKRLPLMGAILVLGIPLSIPYFMQYDLVILALPLILLVYDCFENGCSKGELALTALLWLLPLINWPLVHITGVQFCPVVLIAVAVMIVLRVKREEKALLLREPAHAQTT